MTQTVTTNRSAILEFIRESGLISRSDIARQLDVSLTTVMRILEHLLEEDLVRPSGQSESAGGCPSELIEFNGAAYAVVGVDVGGTKLFGTVADLSGRVQHERYVRHDEGGLADPLERLFRMVEALLEAPRPPGQRVRGIGVGAPGITSNPEGVVVWAPALGWRDLPLKDILSERFDLPALVETDVRLAALGEMGFGAGRGTRNLVNIAIGTGIGAGIVIGGALYRGHHQVAGEIGYLPPSVDFLGRRYEGFGALESLASGMGIAARARELLGEQGAPLLSEGLSAEEVFAAAREGEPWARQVVDETVGYLSLVIASVGALLDPEVVVLGGGVAGSADLLIEPIRQRLEGVIPHVPRIAASPLGRRAAALGAIVLVLNSTMQRFAVQRKE